MKNRIESDVLIIGGGVAGIAAANYLNKNKVGNIIIEKEDELGGLLRPLTYKEYSFDRAVHLSFADEKEVRTVFDRTEYITHKPIAYNWDTDRWIKHPVQNNLYPLELNKKIESITSLLSAINSNRKVENYEDWLYDSYGEYFADSYPAKYTRKYWRYTPEQLDIDWLGPRMAKPNLEMVLEGAMSETERNTYYVREMRYPKEGSYYAFIKKLADEANAICNQKVIHINYRDKVATTKSGNIIHYKYIINTSPLPNLVNCLQDPPDNIHSSIKDLEATQVNLVSIAFNKFIEFQSLWFYIYDEDIYAARCYSPSMKSPRILLEITHQFNSKYMVQKMKYTFHRRNEKRIVYTLWKMKICNKSDILFIEHHCEKNANVFSRRRLQESRRGCCLA